MLRSSFLGVLLVFVNTWMCASASAQSGDELPSIDFEHPTVLAEGDSGFTEVEVSWTLDAPSATDVAFLYRVEAPGAPDDVEPDPPTLVRMLPGTTTGSFKLKVLGDVYPEDDETAYVFVYEVSGVDNVAWTDQLGLGIRIENDDPPFVDPWIVRDDLHVNHGEERQLDPLLNDTLASDDTLGYRVDILEGPLHGSVSGQGEPSSPTYWYAPDVGFVGWDRVRFEICRMSDGECRESVYTIERVPAADRHFDADGTAGKSREPAPYLPAMASPRWRATELVEAEVLHWWTTLDPTPSTPWDSADGVAFELRTLPAASGDPVVHRIDVAVHAGTDFGRQDVFVGVDSNGDGLPSQDEMICTNTAFPGECRLRLVAGSTPVVYWVMAHNRLPAGAGVEVSIHDVPLVDGDGSLVVTGPGNVAGDRPVDLLFAWEDRTLHAGESRRGYVRVESDEGVPAGEIRVDVSIGVYDSHRDALPLRSGIPQTLSLAGGEVHPRIFIDVPAGATRLTVTSDGDAANVDFYVARWTRDLVPGAVEVPAAPWPSEASAQASGPGSDETVVIEGPALAPGRWYIVPDVPGQTAATFSLQATIEAVAPVVRSGSYFNAGRPGSGLFLYPAADQLTGLWYTYRPYDGQPTWYYLQSTAPGPDGIWSSDIYRATWDGDSRTLTSVGRATVTPTDADRFTFSYVLYGETGTQPFAALGRGCPVDGGLPVDISSQWFDPMHAGTGYSVQLWQDYEYYAAYVYDSNGEPMFLAAEAGQWSGDESTLILQRLTGQDPTHVHPNTSRKDVGTLVRRLAGGTLGGIEIDAIWQEPSGATGFWSQSDDVQPLGGAGATQGCEE